MTKGTDSQKCAVWYHRYGSIYVELHDDEQSAARWAVDLAESEEGAVRGVQYADGRFVDRESWDAHKQEEQRRWDQLSEEMAEEWRNPPPRPAKRPVQTPWDTTKTVEILASSPPWVGAQPVVTE